MSDNVNLDDEKEVPSEAIREIMRAVGSTYLTSPRDRSLEREVEALIEGAEEAERMRLSDPQRAVGRLGEGRALVILGKSGAGKTRALDRLLGREKGFVPEDGEAPPAISVTAPSPCTLRLLGHSLLRELGYHSERDLKENVVWEMARRCLALQKVRYVHFDELQHLSQTRNPLEATKVQNTLKGLMQCKQWPVSLILSGLPEIETLIKGDAQLFRRSRFVRFPTLTFHDDAPHIRGIMIALGIRKAGLIVNSVVKDDFVSRLIHAGMGQMGIVIEYVQEAVCSALREESSELQVDHFASVYEARTACNPEENVFTCTGDWTLVNVAAVPDPGRAADQNPVPKPRSNRRAK